MTTTQELERLTYRELSELVNKKKCITCKFADDLPLFDPTGPGCTISCLYSDADRYQTDNRVLGILDQKSAEFAEDDDDAEPQMIWILDASINGLIGRGFRVTVVREITH